MINEDMTIYLSCISLLISIALVYLIWNIIRQRSAERKLESMLKKSELEILKTLEKDPHLSRSWKPENDNSVEMYEEGLLLYYLKNKIESLEKNERIMMTKIFERKSNTDQIRYAFKIFSQAGLEKLFGKSGNHFSANK